MPEGIGWMNSRCRADTRRPSPIRRSTASSMAPLVLPQPTTSRSPSGSPNTRGQRSVFCSAASFRLRWRMPSSLLSAS